MNVTETPNKWGELLKRTGDGIIKIYTNQCMSWLFLFCVFTFFFVCSRRFARSESTDHWHYTALCVFFFLNLLGLMACTLRQYCVICISAEGLTCANIRLEFVCKFSEYFMKINWKTYWNSSCSLYTCRYECPVCDMWYFHCKLA